MSRKLNPVLGCFLILSVGVSLTGCSLLPSEETKLKPPLVKPAQESYRTVAVKKGVITREYKGSGSFESTETEIVQLKDQGGRIEKILVSAGDRVKKGDPLVRLDVDGLDIQLKERELALERAKQSLKQAKNSGDEDSLKIAKLQFEIEKLKYDRLLNTFNSKQLLAGMDGQVTFVEGLKAGDYAEAYRALVVISNPSSLRLALSVDAGDKIADIDVGYPALVSVGKETFEGKVVQTPSSAPDTLNEQLRDRYSKTMYVELPEMPDGVEIGSFADVKILLQKRDDVLVIPRSGLRSYLDRTFVRTLEDGKIREIDVETGIAGSTEIEITKGLEEGAVVVLQ
ncbi:efflux RND transporter periplasmic adaptor subunit [Paenibacillus thermotolerans]|uniref:efflux RND transporter periplasmic adaptor subunit n=1 Tax=Paenibacillus thermotolerans TaxID=3027807 RepID=UPI0023689ECC|nr:MULTISPECIES: biotin/lipoyl-binding protein [unclassified Paenibacillus]